MAAIDECVGEKQNLGLVRCTKLPQLPKGMFTTPPAFKIPVATYQAGQAAIYAYLLAAMKAVKDSRIYFWPRFVGYEDISDPAVYDENILADLFVFNGKSKFNAMFNESLCVHKAMVTHNGSGHRVIPIDIKNQLNGTKLSNGDFAGYLVSLQNMEKLKRSDGQAATKSIVRIVLADSDELDRNGVLLDAGDFLSELSTKKLTDVELALVGNPAVGLIKFTIKTVCDQEDVSGFLYTDFELTKTSDGSKVPLTSITRDATTGVYSAISAGNLFVDGTFNMKAPSLISLDSYESTGSIAIDEP